MRLGRIALAAAGVVVAIGPLVPLRADQAAAKPRLIPAVRIVARPAAPVLAAPVSALPAPAAGPALAAPPQASSRLGAAAASADEGAEGCFLSKANAEREAAGLGTLASHSQLVGISRDHSEEMAAAGTIYHRSDLSAGAPSNWQSLGENVGMGGSCASLHTALMNSPGHRRNILDPGFNYVGMGVVIAGDGTMFVTQSFMQAAAPRTAAASSPAPAPATSAPAPAPATPAPARSSTPRPAARQPTPALVPAAPTPEPAPPVEQPPERFLKHPSLAAPDPTPFPTSGRRPKIPSPTENPILQPPGTLATFTVLPIVGASVLGAIRWAFRSRRHAR